MKHIKSLLQTWLLIILGAAHVVLITRFVADFLGVNPQQPLLQPIYDFSSTLLRPFQNSFVSSEADKSILDFSTLLAIAVFSCIWVFLSMLIKIIFDVSLEDKSKKLLNLFFGSLEVLFLFRFILALLHAGESNFLVFLRSITGVLTTPIERLLAGNELSIVIATFVSMIIVGLAWFTLYKLLAGATGTVQNLESKRAARKAILEKEPRPRIHTTSLKAASTMYSEEVVSSKPEEEPKQPAQTEDQYLVNDPNFVDLEQPVPETQNTQIQTTPETPQPEETKQPRQSLGSTIKGAAKELLSDKKKSSSPFEQEKKEPPQGDMPQSPLG